MKWLASLCLLLLLLSWNAAADDSVWRVEGLVLEPAMQDLGVAEEGQHVLASVLVRNNTAETAQIIAVEASCGCTRAIPDQYILAPGEFTMINIDVDTSGKLGRVKKSVVVTDQAGRQSTAWMTLTVKPSPHAQAGRHTIFDAACARCHAEPARGKQKGQDIYRAVCAMCHGKDARGDYAPDLRRIDDGKALRLMISQGVDPRHMPAFSRAHGGPLTEAQINALVKWLLSLD